MESEDIKEPDAELQSALDAAAEPLQAIVERSTVIGSSDDKFALAAAGFCEGYEMHRNLTSNDRGPDAPTLEAMRFAVQMLERSEPSKDDLALAAKQLKVRIDAICNSFMKAYYQSVEMQFGGAARTMAEKAELTDDEAHEFAALIFRSRPADFFGYVWANDDPKIKCRCPHHFVESFATANVTELQLRDKMRKQFGTHAVAFVRFGHWFHSELNRLAVERLGAAPDVIGEDAKAAGASFIADIMQKGRDES